MENNYEKIQKIINNSDELEFGTTLERAFDNYKKIALVAGLAYLIIGLLIAGVAIGIIGAIYGFEEFTSTMADFESNSKSTTFLLVNLLFTVLFTALFAPVNAGFFKIAHNAEEGDKFGIENLFEYYKNAKFKDLFLSAVLITLVSGGLSTLFEFLNFKALSVILSLLIGFSTFLSIPLIIFSGLNATESISTSIRLFFKNSIAIIGLIIIGILFSVLGIFGLCIGILFTLPFINSTYYMIYRELVPFNKNSELDEIGSSTNE